MMKELLLEKILESGVSTLWSFQWRVRSPDYASEMSTI